MALNGYVKVIDSNGQWLKGDCDLTNRIDWIPIFAAQHSIKLPTTAQGLPTGKHVHLPFSVSKQVDHTTAKFYQFLSEGEVLQEVIIEWYRINTSTNQEEAYCRQTLKNVTVNSVNFNVNENTKSANPNNTELHNKAISTGHMEQVSFIYEGVCWLYHDDGIEFCDTLSGNTSSSRQVSSNQAAENQSAKKTKPDKPKKHYAIIDLNKDSLAWPIKR